MSIDKKSIKSQYPLPAYSYRVTIDSTAVSFAEVSGLSIEHETVTYKHGLSYLMGAKIIPGMAKEVRLTLKRGVVAQNDYLYSWISVAYAKASFKGEERDIEIDLCDESGNPVIRWKVQKALPVRLEAPTFDANTQEVAIESMELVAHGLQIEYL